MERWYLLITEKFLFWTFWWWEICFFKSKGWWKIMIFSDYWKVLVLNFLEVVNTVFFRVKKLMKRWYLLVTRKFLFWTFRSWELGKFFQPTSWWKDDIYFVILSFPLYSRTWEMRFFVYYIAQWHAEIGSFNCCSLYSILKLHLRLWNFYSICFHW